MSRAVRLALLGVFLVACRDAQPTRGADAGLTTHVYSSPTPPDVTYEPASSHSQDDHFWQWMTVHSLLNSGSRDTTHVVHHYERTPQVTHSAPTQSYQRVTTPAPTKSSGAGASRSWSAPKTVSAPAAPVRMSPSPAPRASTPAPSRSFGFRPSASRPATTSFHPSVSVHH